MELRPPKTSAPPRTSRWGAETRGRVVPKSKRSPAPAARKPDIGLDEAIETLARRLAALGLDPSHPAVQALAGVQDAAADLGLDGAADENGADVARRDGATVQELQQNKGRHDAGYLPAGHAFRPARLPESPDEQ